MLGDMKCIFEQFLSATTIPSVALVSAPRTMPSCFLKICTFKQLHIYKQNSSSVKKKKKSDHTLFPEPLPHPLKYCAILSAFKKRLMNKHYWLNPQ